ncbi:MAG: MlaD family protein [Candidatus Binatia bacterium]
MGKTRLKVGVFVIVSFVILATAILWLAGSRFLQPGDTYSIIFSKSVSGLLPGAAVEYQGVTVGKVEKIRLTPDIPPRVAVTIFLEPETPVRQDTVALLVGSFVTGIQIIELEGGSAEAPPLQSGGTIPVKEGELEAFRDSASQIAEALLNTLTRIEQDILSEENRAAISTFLQNVALLTENLRVTFAEVATPETRASLKAMVDNLAQAAAGIRNITETVNQDGKVTMVQIRETANATETLAKEVAQLTRRVDQLLVDNRNEMNQVFTNLAETSRRLRETVDTIRRDPSVVLWGSRLPEKEIPDK